MWWGLHQQKTLSVAGGIEYSWANRVGWKQNLRLAQFHAVSVRNNSYGDHARMIVEVKNFFSSVSPYGREAIPDQELAGRGGKSDNVNLPMSRLE